MPTPCLPVRKSYILAWPPSGRLQSGKDLTITKQSLLAGDSMSFDYETCQRTGTGGKHSLQESTWWPGSSWYRDENKGSCCSQVRQMRLVLDTNILVAALVKRSTTRGLLLLPTFESPSPEFTVGPPRFSFWQYVSVSQVRNNFPQFPGWFHLCIYLPISRRYTHLVSVLECDDSVVACKNRVFALHTGNYRWIWVFLKYLHFHM